MKITIFGSTGKTGIEAIKQALDKGYEVVAFARSPKKIEIQDEHLQIVQGELNNIEAINKAIKGSDAVVSLLGASTGKVKDNSLSEGVKNIIKAMNDNGVKRIIQISTSAAKDPNDRFDPYFDFMCMMVKTAIPKMYEELQIINHSLRESDLDWTIVRAPFLTDDPLSKTLKIGYKGQRIVKKNLSRADLAWFMIEQVEGKEYIQKAPFISS